MRASNEQRDVFWNSRQKIYYSIKTENIRSRTFYADDAKNIFNTEQNCYDPFSDIKKIMVSSIQLFHAFKHDKQNTQQDGYNDY